MIAVLFEAWPVPGEQSRYLELAAALRPALDRIDGFISVERFQSLTEPGKLLSLSFWRDEAAVAAWRNTDMHRDTPSGGPRESVQRLPASHRKRRPGLRHDRSGRSAARQPGRASRFLTAAFGKCLGAA